MKNKLIDLNNHLFEQMERLNDEDLTGDALNQEINRSKAVSQVATQIIAGANLALKAKVAIHECLIPTPPQMLGIEGYKDEDAV